MIEGLNDILKADSARSTKMDCTASVEEYINKSDWRINANANTSYSNSGLVNNLAGKAIANYWLDKVFSKKEGDAHRDGDYHIHDLDCLTPYCCGHDLQDLLQHGFNGVVSRASSKPPKHLREALGQMANFIGILQSEWAGAQAFSSFDTLLAPYVFHDMMVEGIDERDVKKAILSFVYNLNVPSRWGQCVNSSYKCLRADGKWVSHDELQVGESIYVVDVETGELKLDTVTHVNVFDAPEKMHHYSNEHGFNFDVTPNHRVIYKTGSNPFSIKESAELIECCEVEIPLYNDEMATMSKTITCSVTEIDAKTDKVWCPTTNTGTFVCMTDEGYVFLTGNSPFSNVTIDMTVPNNMKFLAPQRGDEPYFVRNWREFLESENLTDNPDEALEKNEGWSRLIEEARKRIGDYDSDEETILYSLTYQHFKKEMMIINKAYYEVLSEGDSVGQPFTFPIPTVNITEDFDWDDPEYNFLFENAALYGSSYFNNFIGSQYLRDENGNLTIRNENAISNDDTRSMCCRLRLDKREIRKRGGGLFGSESRTGCYDDKTEVLTKDGWKFFKDLTLEDEFYTLNENREIELHKPTNLFVYDWEGDMIKFKTKMLDLLVTPNHNMLLVNDGKMHFKHAEECNHTINIPLVGKCTNNDVKYHVLGAMESVRNNTKSYDEVKIPMDVWLKFLGLFLSEGSVRGAKGGDVLKCFRYEVTITQVKRENESLIDEAMEAMPFDYKKYYTKGGAIHWTIYNKQLWHEMKSFGCSWEKYIPDYVFECSTKQMRILYDYMMLGDGFIRKNGRCQKVYYTSSERMADDFQRLLLLVGLGSAKFEDTRIRKSYRVIRGREVQRKHKFYEISVHHRYDRTVKGYSKEFYKGNVYCVEVPNHTLYVRRNGKTVWCGNSIGVVTINMARLGYLHKGDIKGLYKKLDKLCDLAHSVLTKRRAFVEEMYKRGLYPYTRRYVPSYDTYFSTIGVNGMNEMVRNFTNDEYDISDKRGQKMCEEILDHINEKLIEYQETGTSMYNLEATPAEGTTTRFAREDIKRYPDIIQAGFPAAPYYTNSSQLPVDFTADVFTALDLQDELQCKYSGGCVEAGNYVVTNRGRILIDELCNNSDKYRDIKVVSYNVDTKSAEWDFVTDFHKIDVSQNDKIRVIGNGGLDIVTSDWHPFFVVTDDGSVVEKRADELKENDYVLCNSNVMFDDSEKKLTPELAYVIGFYIGDGSMSLIHDNRGGNNIPKHNVCFHHSNEERIKRLEKILNENKLCSSKARKCDKRSKNLMCISTTKKSMYNFLNKYGFTDGEKSKTVCFSDELKYQMNKKNAFALLSGLIDTDAYLDPNTDDIEYFTASEELANDIVWLCSMLGMKCSCSVKNDSRYDHPHYRLYLPAKTLYKVEDELMSLRKPTGVSKNKVSHKSIIKDNYNVVRVKSVSKEEVEDNIFYDLTTEKNHNYLCGKKNYVFIHNTVFHIYNDEDVTAEECKLLLKKVLTNYRLPYVSFTATFSTCPKHGRISGIHEFCPLCDKELMQKHAEEIDPNKA